MENKLFPALNEATQQFHSRENSIQNARNSAFGSEYDFKNINVQSQFDLIPTQATTKLPEVDHKNRHFNSIRYDDGLE